VREPEKPPERQADLLVAQTSLARGEYDKVISESQRVLSGEGSGSLEETALFTLGLVYAHPANPRKDSATAIEFFTRLIDEHPQSGWALQARTWVSLLRENTSLDQSNKKLQSAMVALDQAYKDLMDERQNLAETLKKTREENDNLQQVIKKMKQVDIEIEERKRDQSR
jgi:flagellar motility protein MotE (MotC chaperone)